MRNSAAVTISLLALGGAAFSAGTPARSAPAAAVPAATAPAATAPAGAIQIMQPFNKAVVRESVPIKLRDFPAGGYVSVSIDGRFVTAQALPKQQGAPVYVWDTKATYTDPDSPDTPKTYSDGVHAITVAVYNAQNKLVGQDSVSVQVADKINLPASQGIKLAYPWKTGLTLRYQRRTTLTAAPTAASAAASAQVLQESLLRFERSVENASGGSSLIRDEVIPVDKSVKPKRLFLMSRRMVSLSHSPATFMRNTGKWMRVAGCCPCWPRRTPPIPLVFPFRCCRPAALPSALIGSPR